MCSRSRVLAAAVVALCLAAATRAQADEQSDLEKGRAAYFAKNFGDADDRFRAMLDERTGTLHDPLLVAEARMYWGATLLAEQRPDDAKKIFDRLILDTPEYEPDEFRLPQDVINVFIDERAKLRETLRQQREKALADARAKEQADKDEKARQQRYKEALEKQASLVPVVTKHSRLLALMPFGAGQFQNGDKALGWTFLVGESLIVAAGTVAIPGYLIEVSNENDEYSMFGESHRAQFEAIRNRANAWRDVNLASIGAFALTYIVGVAQAEAAFVPERTDNIQRPLPVVSVAPAAGQAPGGAWLGVTGSF